MSIKMIESPKSRRAGPNSRIHHYQVPDAYKPMADKYRNLFDGKNFSRELVEHQDFQDALEEYATNARFDIYTLMDIFCCSRSTLYAMLQSKDFAPYYEAAKEARADLLLKRGIDVSEEVYYGAMNGDIGRDAVNAAKNLANYCMSYATLISNRYGKKNENEGLNVQIAVPQFSNVNGPEPEDSGEAVVVEGELVESTDNGNQRAED